MYHSDFIYLIVYFWPRCAACGVLVPQPGIEPGPQQGKRRVLTTEPRGKSLIWILDDQH